MKIILEDYNLPTNPSEKTIIVVGVDWDGNYKASEIATDEYGRCYASELEIEKD